MRQIRAKNSQTPTHSASAQADARPQPIEATDATAVPSPAHALQYRLLNALDEHAALETKVPLRWTLIGLFVTCAAFWALVATVATNL